MVLDFCKYQGTGNDFIIIDNRTDFFDRNNSTLIEALCNRRLGIGADGLILLQKSLSDDFEMIYYNADGRESTMCGNGGRCIVSFANSMGLIKDNKVGFLAVDGQHSAFINEKRSIELGMKDVKNVERRGADFFLNTGSPHYVVLVEDVNEIDVFERGREIRYSEEFVNEGTNVNFVQIIAEKQIKVRTYERGVEAETWSCGTGVTAAAIAVSVHLKNSIAHYFVSTRGGALEVKFTPQISDNSFMDIFLIGPTVEVYKGQIVI